MKKKTIAAVSLLGAACIILMSATASWAAVTIKKVELLWYDIPRKHVFVTAKGASVSCPGAFIFLKAQDDSGKEYVGLGDILPRSAVSGDRREDAWSATIQSRDILLDQSFEGVSVSGDMKKLNTILDELKAKLATIPQEKPHPLPPQKHYKATLCGYDQALLDLVGKIHQKPIYELLGGKKREQVTISAGWIGASDSLDKILNKVQSKHSLYTAMRMKIGLDDDEDIEKVVGVAETLVKEGSDNAVWVDVNQAWKNAEHSKVMINRIAEGFKKVGFTSIFIIEQPTKEYNLEELVKVTAYCRKMNPSWPFTIKTMADESMWILEDAQEIFGKLDGADMGNIKIQKAGGLVESMRIGEYLAKKNRGVYIGGLVMTDINATANLHLALALPRLDYVTACVPRGSAFPINPATRPLVFVSGKTLANPQGPGLGTEVALNRLEPYVEKTFPFEVFTELVQLVEKMNRKAREGIVWPVSGTTEPDVVIRKFVSMEGAKGTKPYSSIDIEASDGTPVHAVKEGMVYKAGEYPYYQSSGRIVQLQHEGGMYYTNYMHLSKATVRPGDMVKTGDIIGYSGKSGKTPIPKLTFAYRLGGYKKVDSQDPQGFLPNADKAEYKPYKKEAPSMADFTGTVVWPVSGTEEPDTVASLFEEETSPGIDIQAEEGTPVHAVTDGTVKKAGEYSYYKNHGIIVQLEHYGGAFYTNYAHLSKISVKQGENVSQGTVIGHVGSTGKTDFPKLHFQFRKGGYKKKFVADPLELLPNGDLVTVVSAPAASENEEPLETVWPISGTQTADPVTVNFVEDEYPGIDIEASEGTPVHAIADGIVFKAGEYSYYKNHGKIVQLQHAGGRFYTNYAHLSKISVKKGTTVRKGDIIAYTGKSGKTDRPKLHFQYREGGYKKKYAQDPLILLSGGKALSRTNSMCRQQKTTVLSFLSDMLSSPVYAAEGGPDEEDGVVWPISGTESPDTVTAGFQKGVYVGIDIEAPAGTPVHAAADGTVFKAGQYSYYKNHGKIVQIKHADGEYYTNYAHLSEVSVDKGDFVNRGDIIGYSGDTGRTKVPKLHFQYRQGGYKKSFATDPLELLPGGETITATASAVTPSAATKKRAAPSPGEVVWPISGARTPDKVTAGFEEEVYLGIDIEVSEGTPVHAVADGTVFKAGQYSYYKNHGKIVQLKHADGEYYTNYAHLSEVSVDKGDFVNRGDIIGYSGDTGRTDVPKLHFQYRKGGYKKAFVTDPLELLPGGETVTVSASAATASAATKKAAAPSPGEVVWPISGMETPDIITRGFEGGSHPGIDIVTPEGTPVHAVADGTVFKAGQYSYYKNHGKIVQIKHAGGGYYTNYAHLSKVSVKERDAVRTGDIIGYSGKTGKTDRPKLHFQYRKGGYKKKFAEDPLKILPYFY